MTVRDWYAVVAIAAVAALSSSPAAAVDGEVLIDQAAVNAGGITPGDAPGFPATLNRRGRYKLTGNLSAPAGSNGIEVRRPDVTIDLDGFTIQNRRPAAGSIGIDAGDVSSLTVMDGTIAQFGSAGVLNRPGRFAVIENMRIWGNGGVGLHLESDAQVRNNTITGNESAGVICVSRCLIEGNTIGASRTEAGVVLLTDVGGHLVLGNSIADNKLYGIYAEGPTGFGDNTLVNNNAGGFGGGTQVLGAVNPLHPNFCAPPCP